jgi:4-oxalocrotonate tautomerase
MPIITIEWYEGRDAELKKEMAEKLTDLMVDVGKTQREHVWIRFVDSPKSEWSMGGEIQG